MYLTSVKLENFQKHKCLELKFGPGINVIVGPTNVGKSAILRALFWLFHNRPIKANNDFKRQGSEKPMTVTVKDDRGNKIVRYPNAYKINNDKALKAFNRDVPTPVTDLFPMRPINWQRQLDPPFLVMDTGGKAAKIIGRTIGADDQDMIMAEWKIEKTETRNEIKRTEQNLSEAKEVVARLEDVPDLLEIGEELLEKEKNIAAKDDELIRIKRLLHSIEEIDQTMPEIDTREMIIKLDLIARMKRNIDGKTNEQLAMSNVLESITDIDEQPEIDFDGMEGSLTFIQEKLAAYAELDNKFAAIELILHNYRESGAKVIEFQTVQNILAKIIRIEETMKEYEENKYSMDTISWTVERIADLIKEEEEKEIIMNQLIKEAGGVCPLCMQPWENDKC